MSLLGYINNGLNQSLNGIVTITDGNGTTISDGQITSKNMNVDTFTATNLSSNNLTVTGTLTLPNASILDPYLSANVALKDQANSFTQINTFPRIDFTNVDGVKMLYRTNVNGEFRTEIFGADLKQIVPTFARHLFQIGSTEALYINVNNGDTVLSSGSNMIFDTINTTNEHIFHIAGILVAAIGELETRFKDVEIGFNDGINDSINELAFRNYQNGGFSTLGYSSIIDDGVFSIRASRNFDNVNSVYRDGNITFRIQNAAAQTRPRFSIDDTGAIVRLGKKLYFENEIPLISGSIYSNFFEQMEYDSSQGHRFKINGTEVFNFDSVYAHFFSNLEMDIGYQISFQNAAATVCGQIYANSSQHIIHNSNVKHVFQIATTDVMSISSSGVDIKDSTGTITTNISTDNITTLCVFDKIGTTDGYMFKANGVELGKITTGLCEFFTNFGSRSGFGLRLYDPTNTVLCTVQTLADYRCRYRSEIGHQFSVKNAFTGLFQDVLTVNDRAVSIAGTLTVSGAFTVSSGFNMVQSGTGIISQTGTGVNLMKGITMNANNTLVQSGSGVITQTGTGSNNMKAIILDVDDDITMSGTSIISQSGTGTNLMKAITLDADDNITMSGTSIISQSGTGTNLMNAITLNVDDNITQSGTGIITQSGSSTNTMKPITFTSVTGTKLTYNTNYIVSTATNILRTNVPTGATQHFSVNNVDVVSVSSTTTTIRNNITLPTTWTAKTSETQLGGRSGGTKVTTTQAFSTNVVYNLVALTITTPGVYMIYGLASYRVITSGTLTQEEITIGEGAGGIFQNALTRDINPNIGIGYPIRALNTYYEVTTNPTTLHLNVRLAFTSGTYERNSTSAGNCLLDAIRIA